MVSRRHVLTVFMASPGDVAPERAELTSIVNRINRRSAQDLGWLVELRGWEDTMPGHGRPQGRINPDVESCDVFIGILWRRWGTPTGLSTSGFHEEYEIARARRLNSAEPDLLMYFREVEPSLVNDAGEQLKQVLAFKARLAESQEVLYKQYDSVQQFSSLVEEHLTRILQARALSQRESDQRAVASATGRLSPDSFGPAVTLSALSGNPYMDAEIIAERWSMAARSREISLSPCAVGCGQLWALDPLDRTYGGTLILGASGLGGTNAVRAICLSMVLSYPPGTVELFVLDTGFNKDEYLAASIGASTPAFDIEALRQEVDRRSSRLVELGHNTVKGLWRREPSLREEFPVWVVCVDEGTGKLRQDHSLEQILDLARLSGLVGIHFVVAAQWLLDYGVCEKKPWIRRIALWYPKEQEYLRFTGGLDPFGFNSLNYDHPGIGVCIEGDIAFPIRFALADETSIPEAIILASNGVAGARPAKSQSGQTGGLQQAPTARQQNVDG